MSEEYPSSLVGFPNPVKMRAMNMLFRLGAVALGAILAVIPAPASAQTDEERAGARAAGLAGLEAYQAGKYDQAVDYFGRAESLMHAPTHLLYLAAETRNSGAWSVRVSTT